MNGKIFKVLFVSVFTAMLGMGIVVPLMAFYAENLGATGIWLGVIFSAFSLSRLIFMPLIGRLSDKRGRKIFIISGLLVYCIVSVAYVFAYDVYSLSLVRFVHGFGSAMVIPVAMAYVGEIAPRGREGEYMGTFTISFFLGMGFGPFIGGVVRDMAGMESVFYLMTAFSAFSFAVSILFLPNIIIKNDNKNYSNSNFGPKTKNYSKTNPNPKTNPNSNVDFKIVFRNRIIGSIFFYRFIYALGAGGIMAFLPLLASNINLNSTQIGVAIAFNVFITAFLQRPFGKVADRYGKTALISYGLFLSGLSLSIMPRVFNFYSLLALSSIMGLGGAISLPAALAVMAQEGRIYGHGSLMGLFNSAMSLGMILGPLVSGIIMDLFEVNFIFYFIGGATVMGSVLLIAVHRRTDATAVS